MMAKRYPWLKGLQDPILDQTMSFRRFQLQPFVQILHNGVTHWVAISTFNCKPGEIMLMDSLKEELLCISKSRFALLWTVKRNSN